MNATQIVGVWLLASVLLASLWAAVGAGLKRRSFTRHCDTTPNVIDIRRPRRDARRATSGSWL